MYERSAIVLERFFANLLGLGKVNNLKKNFDNYCELFEKFKVVQQANSDEIAALKDFQSAENEIEEIQNHEEKLYKKNAKLEYNRDLIFQDITQRPEEIEKCSLKLENDIAKTQEKLVSLRAEFVEAVRDYNEKKSFLEKCKKNRKNAENDYNEIFEETQKNLENIPVEYIETAKEFRDSEILQKIISTLAENGKDEKIPFNNQVITNAAQIGFDITEREVESYLDAYTLAQKLVTELLEGAVSMELHEKTIRNISVKLSFLSAEKEYIVGFLDYERITVIYGKRMHRNLMIEACEKLEKDIEQVDNLYQILLKEIAEKSTKKAYRDLYNKSYLMEIEDKDAKFKKEKNRVNIQAGTVMNSNYWRIEGIKNIYTVFYKNVVEIFGKDLDEFEIPEEQDESEDDSVEIIAEEIPEKIAEEPVFEIAEEVAQKPVKANIEKVVTGEVEEIDEVSEARKAKAKKVEKIQEIVDEEAEDEDSQFVELSSKIDSVFDEIDDLEAEELKTQKVTKVELAKKTITRVEKAEITEEADISKKTLKLGKIVKKRGRKKVRHYTRQIVQCEGNVQTIDKEPSKEYDIFGEKYQDIDLKLAELQELEEYPEEKVTRIEDSVNDDNGEESMFDVIEGNHIDFSEIDLEENFKKRKTKTKNKLFDSFKKINSKSKKKLASE